MPLQKVNLGFNGIMIIQSLKDDESQTGEWLYNDIVRRLCDREKMIPGFVNIETKNEFIEGLYETLFEHHQKYGVRPFLHFEIHGDEEGLLLCKGERVTWSEFGAFTRKINRFLNNELFISLATCKGAHCLKGIDPTIIAPFWGMVGPLNDIFNYEVVEDFTAFYQELLTSFDLQASIDALNNSNVRTPYVFMTAEKVFEVYIEQELLAARGSELNTFIEQCKKTYLMKN